MTIRKLMIGSGFTASAIASALCLTGCAANADRTSGPHPTAGTGNSYVLSPDPKDPNTVALVIEPDDRRLHGAGVLSANLNFKADLPRDTVKVFIVKREGKHTELKVVVMPDTTGPHPVNPNTTGPHPITVNIDSSN